MNIQSTYKKAFQPKLVERHPEYPKQTTGMENVARNTTGDNVDPETTFVIFKDDMVEGRDKNGAPVLQVADMGKDEEGVWIRKGWIPKEAFQDLGDAYYLPTYKHSPTSSLIGGVSRGLVSAGVPGAIAGAVSGATASRFGESTTAKFGIGALAGMATLTAYQAASHGGVGLTSALFAGGVTGLVAAASGDGDASIRDAMLGGTALGVAAQLTTGMKMAVLTGSAATAIGAQVENRAGQVLLSAGVGAGLAAAQALIAGTSVPLALGIGAALGGGGSLIGPSLGQASRNLQAAVEPVVSHGVGKLLEGRGDTAYKVASAIPQAVALGSLGGSLGLVVPGLAPLGIAIGATAGGLTAYKSAGERIENLKKLNSLRNAQLTEKLGQENQDANS